jgi:hypothetical protein
VILEAAAALRTATGIQLFGQASAPKIAVSLLICPTKLHVVDIRSLYRLVQILGGHFESALPILDVPLHPKSGALNIMLAARLNNVAVRNQISSSRDINLVQDNFKRWDEQQARRLARKLKNAVLRYFGNEYVKLTIEVCHLL